MASGPVGSMTLCWGLLWAAACRVEPGPPSAEPARAQDIRATALALDLSSLEGQAAIEVQPGSSGSDLRLDVSGLTVAGLWRDGQALSPQVDDGVLRVPAPSADRPVLLEIDYGFSEGGFLGFSGWMPALGVSFLWPDHCARLFPCDPSPADGVTFSMEVAPADPDADLIYPSTTWTDAPSYMPGIAQGNYEKIDLGRTSAGTQLWAWALQEQPVAQKQWMSLGQRRAAAQRAAPHVVAAAEGLRSGPAVRARHHPDGVRRAAPGAAGGDRSAAHQTPPGGAPPRREAPRALHPRRAHGPSWWADRRRNHRADRAGDRDRSAGDRSSCRSADR